MTNYRIDNRGVDAAVRIGKALDHPLRVRALAALRDREICVCELVGLFGLAPSTVSKHMSVIADAGLITRRREGKWTYYALAADTDADTGTDTGADAAFRALTGAVLSLAENDAEVLADRERIRMVRCNTEGEHE